MNKSEHIWYGIYWCSFPFFMSVVRGTSRQLQLLHQTSQISTIKNNEKNLKYCENFQKMTQSHEVSKCYWKHDARSLVPLRVATKLQLLIAKKEYLQSAMK